MFLHSLIFIMADDAFADIYKACDGFGKTMDAGIKEMFDENPPNPIPVSANPPPS